MKLDDLVSALAKSRRVSAGYEAKLRCTARRFGQQALTEEVVSEWLIALEREGLSLRYVRGQRANVITLWNFGAERGWIDYPRTKLIRSVQAETIIPTASTPAELKRLLDACDRLDGHFQNYPIRRATLMRAFVLVCWDTALRPWCDVLRLRREWIAEDGQIVVVQSKTKWPMKCRIRGETAAAIDDTFPPERRLIFECGYKPIYYNWKLIRQWAGVRIPPKQIRASRATDAERRQPGSAPQVLGHKPGSQVAYQHYVDPRIAFDAPPEPPPLAG